VNSWKLLLEAHSEWQSAGFSIESDICFAFTPDYPDNNETEVHLLLLANKMEQQPFFGHNRFQQSAPFRHLE
jgi:hypothetical protein